MEVDGERKRQMEKERKKAVVNFISRMVLISLPLSAGFTLNEN